MDTMLRGRPTLPLETLRVTRPNLPFPNPSSTLARTLAAALALALTAPAATAQTFPAADPVIEAIWAPESWNALATPESLGRMTALQVATRQARQRSLRAAGGEAAVAAALEQAGALGVLTGNWSRGWGANKIFDAVTTTIPSVHLNCGDYSLVHRLASRSQGPHMRLDARAEFHGEVPASNILAVLPGEELPEEYALLTAHLDSWEGGSGATDSGNGTIMMSRPCAS